MDEPQPASNTSWRLRFRRFRFQVSLLTALLLMTIVGMAVVIVQLWREVHPLRQEVGRLRQELGYLSIKDESKIYAVQVASGDPDVYRYRFYLPKNHTYKIHSRIRTIPGQLPQMTRQQWFSSLLTSRSGTTSAVESGEHTIDVRLRHDPAKKDYWTLEETILGRGTGSVGTEMPWLNDRRAWSFGGDVSIGKQQEFDPAGGIVLFALRQGVVKEINGGYSTMGADASKELPGVMFWIAPADSGP